MVYPYLMITLNKTFFFLFFLFFRISCQASLATDSVYLTWQRDPLTTMTIQWITPLDDLHNEIQYKPIEEITWKTATGSHFSFPDSTHYLIHRVELLDLLPNHTYEFKIENKTSRFSTLPDNLSSPIRFVEGGDMYHDGLPLLEKMCRQAAKTNPNFAIVGGDIAYSVSKPNSPQRIERWIDWVRNWSKTMVTEEGKMIPCIACIGNHEISGQYNQKPEQAIIFSSLFPMPGPQIYNVLDIGKYASFILLDSSHANPIPGKQTAWLKNTLEARKNIPYKFAFYHVGAYPSVRSFNHAIPKQIRNFWVPHFERNKISLAFEHHEHAFKRTYPLLKNKVHPEGIIYLGDGAWGVEKPRQPRKYRRLYYLAKAASTRHFYLVTLKSSQCEVLALGEDGIPIDQFTLPIKN